MNCPGGFEPQHSAPLKQFGQARVSGTAQAGIPRRLTLDGRLKSRFRATWIISLALAACAPLQPLEPQRPPEVRTVTVKVEVPIAVPCFSESERPVRAPSTPINLDTATVDQMAAAIAADDLADQLFARAVDALFVLCMRRIADGTATITTGGKQ